jgi:hypothetical protein
MTSSEAQKHLDDEAVRFLDRDFDQAFTEKRRLEDVAWDICKFAFTVHSTVVAAAIAAYEFSREKSLNLVPAARVLLAMGFVTGLFLLFLQARNRVYFVVVARYINKHRKFFLDREPLGFQNTSGFYADPSQPPFFSWASSQTWATYLVAALNSSALGAFTFLALDASTPRACSAGLAFVLSAALQMLIVRGYLRSREGKKDNAAVFGTPDAAPESRANE